MDTPRKWQIASVATAVASMSIGGVMLARPTDQAVASIDLETITDSRDLSIASPGDPVPRSDRSLDTPQIVSPEVIEGSVLEPAPPATSVDSPDTSTTSGQTESGQPAPSRPPPDSPSSPDSSSSVDSPSSIDS